MELTLLFKTVALAIAIIANVMLAALVYSNNPKSATNRVYAALSLVISLWLAINYASILPALLSNSLLWIRLSIFVATAMNGLFLMLALTLPNAKLRPTGWRLVALVAIFAFVMAVCISPLAFSRVEIVNHTPQPVPGPGIAIFALSAIISNIFAIVTLMLKMRRSQGIDREKLRYIMFGVLALFTLLIATILIPVIFFGVSLFIGFLPFYTLIFLALTTYAIIRHRLFDIRALVAKTAAYVLLLPTLAGLYGAAIFGLSYFVFPSSTTDLAEKSTYVGLAVILAFTYQPIRRFFEKITDGIFFHDRYDSEIVFSHVTSILASELHLQAILGHSLEQICRHLRISGGQFIILDAGRVYFQMHSGEALWDQLPPEVVKLLGKGILVADELSPGVQKNALIEHKTRVSLALKTKEELVGFLFLGDKLSGETYSDQDLKLLEILRQEMAVAIVNAKAYEEISNFNATLQERIAKATRHLSLANKKLKVLDKTKDDFISMASHQLGTPLTAVTGYLSMALDEDHENMTVGQREYVTIALESSERLVNMAGDLLNVSRLNAGRFNIISQTVELVPLIEQEMLQMRPAAERKNLELSFAPPASLMPPVSIDESKTRQVIMNFIDNAIYYTQKGSIKVTLEQVGQQAVFRVTDTGMGVPPEEQAKLFAKFYRADNAKAARPDGTGLGLYLAKRVIEDQGGEIIFESTLGEGSTFGFKLPLIA